MLLEGKPLIWHVLNRVRQAKCIDSTVLAIPQENYQQLLIDVASELGIDCLTIKGDVNDLLFRYQTAAKYSNADVIVRVPGDNPCVDPDEIDRIVLFQSQQSGGQWLCTNLDRNVLGDSYPGGLGAEVYDAWFLHWLHTNVDYPMLREHPHLWAYANGRIRTIPCPKEFARPELHFDVNTQADFDFIRDIYAALYPTNPNFRSRDIIQYLDNKREHAA